jgi:hypothetical protein
LDSTHADAGPTVIPERVRDLALSSVRSEYGSIASVYAQAAIPFPEWARAEPRATLGIKDSSITQSPVYVLFIRGQFVVEGPVRPDGSRAEVHYVAGRIVADATGSVLNLQLWPREREPDPPVGPPFDR